MPITPGTVIPVGTQISPGGDIGVVGPPGSQGIQGAPGPNVNGFISRVANYTLTPSDSNKYILCSNGSWTLTLPAPTLGLCFYLRNELPSISAPAATPIGTITIQPNGGTINGLASLPLLPAQECFVITDGTNWRTFNLQRCVLLGTIDVSAATTNIPILLPVGYRIFELEIAGLQTAAQPVGVQGLFSKDGGNTWTTATTGYYYQYIYASAVTTLNTNGGQNIAFAYLGWPGDASPRGLVRTTLSPGSATAYVSWVSESMGWNGTYVGKMHVSGFYNTLGGVNAIQVNVGGTQTIVAANITLKGFV